MAEPLRIGEEITLGWNGAKLFADRGVLSSCTVRVEAIGHDWIVIRHDGRAYAYGFTPRHLGQSMRKLLEG